MVEKSVACDTNPKAGRRGLLRADLEWPWRGTALDGAELPVTCSLPARRCGRPPPLSHPSAAASPAKHSSDSPLNVSCYFPSCPPLLFHPSILLNPVPSFMRSPRGGTQPRERITYSWMRIKLERDNCIVLIFEI